MDKRIIKTEQSVYKAMTSLLNVKDFSKITIEDILNEASISRSTFYAHYKTKEEVLNSLLNHIFDHVFSHSLEEEHTHDFSKSDIFDYIHLFTHILYHLHDEKDLVKAILSNSTNELFYAYMRNHLKPISTMVVSQVTSKDIPLGLHIDQITESFIITINYWFKTDFNDSPEKITSYFIDLIK